MGILNDYQRAALALIAVSVAVLYGAAIAYPASQPQSPAAVEWVALPNVAPLPVAPAQVASRPDFDAAEAAYQPGVLTVSELRDKFSAVSFNLDAIRLGDRSVPRLYADTLPPDLNKLAQSGDIKQTFFQMVLPLALKVNEEILADRHRLLLLQKQIGAGRTLSSEQQIWLSELADRYGVETGDVSELMRRVDVISPALALAQSAEESGWGRSRFAMKGNALFGQRTWRKGSGIVPEQRDDGGRYEVRTFASLLDSVRGYARNLNGHPAYADFRAQRAMMRARDGVLDPYSLVETLTGYSERREEYVQTIQKILRVDSLEELEDTRLEERPLKVTQIVSRLR